MKLIFSWLYWQYRSPLTRTGFDFRPSSILTCSGMAVQCLSVEYARYKLLPEYLEPKEMDFIIHNYENSVPRKVDGMNSIYYIIVNSKQQGPSSKAKSIRASVVLISHLS